MRSFTTDGEWEAYEMGMEDGLAGLEEAVEAEVERRVEAMHSVPAVINISDTLETDMCSYANCESRQIYDGYCGVHYRRLRLSGSVTDRTHDVPRNICTIPGCERTHNSRGMCKSHVNGWRIAFHEKALTQYMEKVYTQPMETRRKSRRVLEGCAALNCDKPGYAKSFCKMHYTNWIIAKKRSEQSGERYIATITQGTSGH